MGTCPALNQAVDGTTISVSEYNSNMNNLRSSVNAVVADQITDGTITIAKMAVALGAANTKVFSNAAGTNYEWATGVKIGTFNRDLAGTSGDVAYTGVGFKPSHVLFISVTESNGMSWGIDNGTNHYCSFCYGGTFTISTLATNSITVANSAGSGSQTGLIKTLDADGFTITYAKTGSPTGTINIYYLAIR
jgi:hypothetical protein